VTEELVIGLAKEAITVTLLLAAPMLGIGLGVGLLISMFQAVTQVQEMTLTFVPKIVAVLIGMLAFSPWMLNLILDFTRGLLQNFPTYVK
jgi:flagellar biosynthetic protein FliQ